MTDFISKHTGQQIDDGIDATAKIPTLESSINTINTDKADKTELPTKLPNPNAITINGQAYDGTSAVDITISGSGSLPVASGSQLGGVKASDNINVAPDGTMNLGIFTNDFNNKFRISIANDGTVQTKRIPIDMNSVPEDFPKYTITGKSAYKADFYVTPHGTGDYGYLMIINHLGQLLWYKNIGLQCSCFRKVTNSKGLNRYTYLENYNYTKPALAGGYLNTELVVLDENFVEIDRVRNKAAGHLTDGWPAENHDYIYIDDAHYILASYFKISGSALLENSIQEIKNGKVIWHWETSDYPELATLSHTTPTSDYAHFNSFVIDYDGNMLVSFRNIGLLKINRSTKEIMWIMGRLRNDFSASITEPQLCFQQHDIQLVKKDGSFTVFDNYGHTSSSRICRYNLNETDMTAIYYEYVTPRSRSAYMGSSQLIDDSKEIFDIAYGSDWSSYAFEEYDFKNDEILMRLSFVDGHDVYRVYRDVDDLYAVPYTEPLEPPIVQVDKTELNIVLANATQLVEATYTTDSWAAFEIALTSAQSTYDNVNSTQAQVNTAVAQLNTAISNLVTVTSQMPTADYEIHNVELTGSNLVDTGITLFDTDKDFTLIYKINVDESSWGSQVRKQIVLLKCVYEDSTSRGVSFETGSFINVSEMMANPEMYLRQSNHLTKQTTNFKNDGNFGGVYTLVFTKNSATNIWNIDIYGANNTLLETVTLESVYSYSELAAATTLKLGGRKLLDGTEDRFLTGTIQDAMYYESLLSIEEITTIKNSLY